MATFRVHYALASDFVKRHRDVDAKNPTEAANVVRDEAKGKNDIAHIAKVKAHSEEGA